MGVDGKKITQVRGRGDRRKNGNGGNYQRVDALLVKCFFFCVAREFQWSVFKLETGLIFLCLHLMSNKLNPMYDPCVSN